MDVVLPREVLLWEGEGIQAAFIFAHQLKIEYKIFIISSNSLQFNSKRHYVKNDAANRATIEIAMIRVGDFGNDKQLRKNSTMCALSDS